MRLVFPYLERLILRTNGIGVQKIQYLFMNSPLPDEKIGVWCAMSTRRAVPTFFGQDVQRVNNLLRWYTDHIRSGGRHFAAFVIALVSFY